MTHYPETEPHISCIWSDLRKNDERKAHIKILNLETAVGDNLSAYIYLLIKLLGDVFSSGQ